MTEAGQEFVDDLVALWDGIGSPPVLALALRLQQPPARFQFLVEPRGSSLPDWMDVQALLDAVGENDPHVVQGWRRRWEALLESRPEHSGASPLAAEPSCREGNAAGILRNALAVTSREEFVMRLENLRTMRRVSFGQIARHAKGRLPKSTANWMVTRGNFPAHADQVRCFVRACGVGGEEADLWVQAWERARHMYTAVARGDDLQVHVHKRTAENLASQGRYQQAYELMRSALEISTRDQSVPDEFLLVGASRKGALKRSARAWVRESQSR